MLRFSCDNNFHKMKTEIVMQKTALANCGKSHQSKMIKIIESYGLVNILFARNGFLNLPHDKNK